MTIFNDAWNNMIALFCFQKLEGGGVKEHSSVILFDESKGELFRLGDGFKTLHKKLKTQWKVIRYGITIYSYSMCLLIMFLCTTPNYSVGEKRKLSKYIKLNYCWGGDRHTAFCILVTEFSC